VPIVKLLGCRFPLFLSNDANAAALGEAFAGAGKDYDSMVMVTLGTGIGGGVIINRRIFEGFNGMAGEVGHTVIALDGWPCHCGRKGCWEVYASATGLVRMTCEAMERHPESLLHACLSGNPPHVSGRTAFLAARQGDAAAKQVVDRYLYCLAAGLVNVISSFQPEAVCLGGGVSHEGDPLLVPLRALVEEQSFCRYVPQTIVRLAELGNDAGLIGAALLGRG
jgi:glucokinase